jgi:hypothetical protein
MFLRRFIDGKAAALVCALQLQALAGCALPCPCELPSYSSR